MTTCANCGHPLGVGRFCTHCGQRIDGRGASDPTAQASPAGQAAPAGGAAGPDHTAVRLPAVPPAVPPTAPAAAPAASPAAPPPPPPPPPLPATSSARFPLWADEASGPQPDDERGRSAWLGGAAVAVVLVLVAALGTALLLGGGSEDPGTEDGSDRPAATAPRTPAQQPTPEPSDPADDAEPSADAEGRVDLVGSAEASAPRTAPASSDTDGNMTRYDAANMLDQDPRTCWRARGDATGLELMFRFAEPVELSAVGLVNGYAKTDGTGRRALDWYAGNRRVTAVSWTFEDGTTVVQDLVESRSMQSLEFEPVTTGWVRLRLVGVTEPGTGRARRDFTAISDVTLLGTPADAAG